MIDSIKHPSFPVTLVKTGVTGNDEIAGFAYCYIRSKLCFQFMERSIDFVMHRNDRIYNLK